MQQQQHQAAQQTQQQDGDAQLNPEAAVFTPGGSATAKGVVGQFPTQQQQMEYAQQQQAAQQQHTMVIMPGGHMPQMFFPV